MKNWSRLLTLLASFANHQPKKNDQFQHTVQTPLSIGLPLTIHSRVRDKNLVNNLSEVYIGSDYRRILDLEKRVEQAVLQRIKETVGFCLPDFFKKGNNIWFAIDNIDLLEDCRRGRDKPKLSLVCRISDMLKTTCPPTCPLVRELVHFVGTQI